MIGWGVVIADHAIHTAYTIKVSSTTIIITLTGRISTGDSTATGGTTLGTALGHRETERTMLQPRQLTIAEVLSGDRVIGWEGSKWAWAWVWYGGGELESWRAGVAG